MKQYTLYLTICARYYILKGELNLKKLITCGLAASLVLSLFSACSKAPGDKAALPKLDSANPVSIEIWHYYNGPQKTAFDAMVNEFNETVGMEQGIIVEAFSQGNVDGLISKVVDAAEKKVGAEDVPDIFAAYADTAYEVDKLGLLTDLNSYLTEEEISEYRSEFVDEGHLYGDEALKIFPIAKSVELFMLNKTDWQKFADATGAQMSDLTTIEGVTRTAGAYYSWTDSLTSEPNDGKAFFGRDALANYFIIGAKQLGVELFEGSGADVTINVDKDAMRKLWDNYYVPMISGYFSAGGKFRSDEAHIGDIVALVGSSSGATYFPSEVSISDLDSYPIECAILPAPRFEGGEPYAIQQGAGMAVTKSDAKTEYACTIFLKWFTEEQRNIDFSVGSGYLPVKNAALSMDAISPALADLDAATAQRIDQIFTAALEQLDTCTLYTTRAFDGGNAARSVLTSSMSALADSDRKAVLTLMDGGLSHEEAVARFNTDEHFEAWYSSFAAELAAAHQAG